MSKDKYRRVAVYNSQTKEARNIGIKVKTITGEEDFCLFVGNNAETNAQKVCDLLNETSRSQGKHS